MGSAQVGTHCPANVAHDKSQPSRKGGVGERLQAPCAARQACGGAGSAHAPGRGAQP